MYGDEGSANGHCRTCNATRLLHFAASQLVGIALMAMCDHCGDEFVYLESDAKADLRECRRGY